MRTRAIGAALSAVVLGATLVGVQSHPAQAATLPSGFAEQIVFSGLTQPTNIEFAPDGRIFVAEKRGTIQVFDNLADTTPTQFANLTANVHNLWDRGLLGMALSPNFPADPSVYVLYAYDAPPGQTAPFYNDNCDSLAGGSNGGNCVVTGRLSKLDANGQEQVLIHDWCQQYPSHSTGDLHFGQDGQLYVSSGDGASFSAMDRGQFGSPVNPCGDPLNEGGAVRSQDIRSTGDPTGLNGSVLRLNPVTGAASAGNPNIGSPDLNTRRIVAHGLRNPYRFTMRPGTNEVWLGDVGWNTWEDIERVQNPTGGVTNFGWPCYEGAGRMSSYDNANLPLCESLYTGAGQTAPYFTYNHSAAVVAGESCGTGGDALAGLAFAPTSGGSYPAAYAGAMFFADYSRACIWAMKPATAGALPSTTNIEAFVQQAAAPADLAMGPGGELYYVDLGGTVRRIRYTPGNQPPVSVITANTTSGGAPLTVNFNATGSTDPDAADTGRLTYQWDFTNDGTWDSNAAIANYTYSQGNYTTKLRVTDTLGATGESTVQIQAGNSAPTAVIDTPAAGLTWKVGDTISFTGQATDPQEGSLPASKLSWELRVQHCETPSSCHTHSAQTWNGVASGSLLAPDHEYPSYLELVLTATDSQGLTSTSMRRLDPKTVLLNFGANPPGLQLTVGSYTGITPFSREVIQGSSNTLSAPTPQTMASISYDFVSWSDGGSQTHVIAAPVTAATYTAQYNGPPPPPCGDTFGYVCTTAPMPFQSAANALSTVAGDEVIAPVALPFAIPFYGSSYSQIWVETNGKLHFADPGGTKFGNETIPSAAAPNAAVYPFWDDFNMDASSSVRTEAVGVAPNRQFVVEWRDALFYGTTERVSVSAALGEDGKITFHYSGIGTSTREQGDSGTVGIENATGSTGVQYAFNQVKLVSGTAITFSPPPSAPPTNVVTGIVSLPGGSTAGGLTVALNPVGMTTTTAANGSYTFNSVPTGSYTVVVNGRCLNNASASIVVDGGTETVNVTAAPRTDSFGYHCAGTTDAFEPAANVLAAATGDDALVQVTLPFPVSFYGTSYTTAWVDTNGKISFTNPGGSAYNNEALPTTNSPNATVYPFWDDFVVDASSSIRTQDVGTAASRRFVVEWRNVNFYGTSERVTFEAVFWQSGKIVFAYADIDASYREQGASATIGIENPAGTVGLQYTFDTVGVHTGEAIRFYKP